MYSSSLTDAEWEVIEKLLDNQRKRKWDLRTQILDGIFYVLKSGCQWRMLPKEFAPWKTVYDYFYRWKKQKIWAKLHEALRRLVRQKEGKFISPSLGIVDSQSVATGTFIEETKGFDGNKKIKGRKRHVMVDTLGLIIAIAITAANVSDKEGFILLAKG
ncbi:MAG: IS5 family transposase [Chitinophagales bacterium]